LDDAIGLLVGRFAVVVARTTNRQKHEEQTCQKDLPPSCFHFSNKATPGCWKTPPFRGGVFGAPVQDIAASLNKHQTAR
jgi:hypothetical protein